jgi:hypothetical protein
VLGRPILQWLAEWWANAWRWVLMAAGAVIATYIVLQQHSAQGGYTAFAVAAFVVAAALLPRIPLAVALMAMPLLLVSERAGLGGANLSVSDVALAAAFGTAILLGKRPYSPPLRRLLWLNLLYQFATLFTVIVNPFAANTVEWFHAWMLVSGALIVGWALGRGGYARPALLLLIAGSCVIAAGTFVAAVVQYAHGHFGPVYPSWPFPMQKNFAGTVMAFAAVIAYVNPVWMAWSTRWVRLSFALLCVGIVMTQSRQAIVGFIVAILVIALRKAGGGHSRWVLVLSIPGIWLVIAMVLDQLSSNNQFNSTHQRLEWLREMYAWFKLSPVFGHGLRFWYEGGWANFQPPQAEIEVVTESGLVGLAAFVAMWVGVLVVLWRVAPQYGTLAFAIMLSRIVQGQFDIFWVATSVSLPFVIVGICLGAHAYAQERDAEIPAVRSAPSRDQPQGGLATAAGDRRGNLQPSLRMIDGTTDTR